MTKAEENIDMATAAQVDISDIIPAPSVEFLNAAKELAKEAAKVEKALEKEAQIRKEIQGLRDRIADLAAEGDDAMLITQTAMLRSANNRLDRAIEANTDTDLTDAKANVTKLLEAL